MLDPRGISHNGEETILGDQKYDLAKLCHSVIGLYDYVISGRYHLDGDLFNNAVIRFDIDTRIKSIQQEFYEYKFLSNISVGEIMPLTTLLFLSMLPLHSDRPIVKKLCCLMHCGYILHMFTMFNINNLYYLKY